MQYYDTETFRARRAFLNESQHWGADRLASYQLDSLRGLLVHAHATVPYYRSLFDGVGLEPGTISRLSDIRQIPFLTKDIIRANYDSFLSDSADPGNLTYMTTGGSTGDPLVIRMDSHFKAQDLAFTFHYLDVAGYSPFVHRSVRLHGDTISRECLDSGQYWSLDGDLRLVMSVYHISEATCSAYVDQLNRFKPHYIHAYPSAVSLLCDYILNLHLSVDFQLGCVFCDSETLYPGQRELIQQVFGCKVHSVYGHTEGCVYGTTCPASDVIHILPQCGVFELLRPDGTPCCEEGEQGEIVVTGFQNRVFPFIRYRTFDIGTMTVRETGCGWEYPKLQRVEGRMQDYVVDRFGVLVPLAPALFDYNVDWTGIDRFQVFQDTAGRLLYRLVSGSRAGDRRILGERIAREFGRVFNNAFEIDVEFVDAIPRTKRGKFRYLDQRLDIVSRFGAKGAPAEAIP